MPANQLHFFTGFTLVDITATGVVRGDHEDKRNQQRNWETVLQATGLGAQPIDVIEPKCIETDLEYLEFGDFYQGRHRVWCWYFAVEHNNVFQLEDNPVAGFDKFFSQVPIICGLDETARFMLPIFFCEGALKNVYFKSGIKDISNI